MVCYVGVDVSCDSLDVAFGTHGRRFPNTPQGIHQLVGQLSHNVHVVLEPTSTYHHHLVQRLAELGVSYTLINPAHTAAFAQVQGRRAKTDKADARLLVAFGMSQQPRPTPPPDQAQERLRSLRRHLEWLKAELGSAQNRLDTTRRSPWTPPSVLHSLERTVKERQKELERVEEELEQLRDEPRFEHDLKLLTSIPGIGWASALLLLSELPAVSRCASAKSWVAFSGVCPAPHQSGKLYRSQLSRAGSTFVRAGLYLPAISAMRCNGPIRQLNQRLKAKGKPGRVRIMACMNKLLRLCFGVLKSGRPFDPSLPLAVTAY